MAKTIQSAGELARNPRDHRRTRSQFESALSIKDPCFDNKYFLMVESYEKTYEYSCEYPIWKTSMKEEFHLLQKNDTWDLVILPPRRKLSKCKWVFKIKFSDYGYPMNYKARLVSKGFSQLQFIDYNETFVPVAKIDSIRLVLAITTSKQWEVHHMDVKSSFIHGDIKEEIYMKEP